MKYYSLTDNNNTASFSEAVIRGLAPDRGLYFPESTPRLDESFLADIATKSMVEIGVEVMRPFVGGTIPEVRLEKIVTDTLCFDFPVNKINDNTATLELFHGPTMAFKDVGARFMARCIGYFNEQSPKKVTVLVATSGDTGGAVASGFLGIEGTEVIILYPKGKVSHIQELQLTTNGNNIKAVEVDGVFDDCQEMVKSAFIDEDLKGKLNLTSANSINVARWLPQSLYFFFAYQQFQRMGVDKKLAFSVPSGNFGNICAGIVAKILGLPISHFIASTNINDTVPRYLETQDYQPNPSKQTISNAMDVGAPSNFARMESIFGSEWERMRSRIAGFAYDDEMTRDTIRRVNAETGYTLEPHGAVGWMAAEAWRKDHPEAHTVVLETAHPSKFLDVMEEELGKSAIEIPERLACLADREKVAIQLGTDESAFQDWLEGLE